MGKSMRKSRIEQEKYVVTTMIDLYCRKNHHHRQRTSGSQQLCPSCQELAQYAMKRLDRCRYGENKSFCTNCSTHCYQKLFKQQIKEIMRFSGPRMILYHPVIAIKHMLAKRHSD